MNADKYDCVRIAYNIKKKNMNLVLKFILLMGYLLKNLIKSNE